ncbi:GNAT family N-acetyltransferase [Planococcus dechangensis]|uniref:GNAT family N-acetyltransferase n=1 Tax=Planococcus dechangensis TaxID=1176255 RepID=A0ABV9MCY3_9BACL
MQKDNRMQAVFETKRCCIRPFIESDLDAFVVYRNNLEWMEFQYFKGLAREEYEKILLREPSVEKGAQFAIIRKNDQALLGDIFMKKEAEACWIGYTISPSFKRQGYAYETIQGMIRWIQQSHRGLKILAGTSPENLASIQLLKKLEFAPAGTEEGELVFQYV